VGQDPWGVTKYLDDQESKRFVRTWDKRKQKWFVLCEPPVLPYSAKGLGERRSDSYIWHVFEGCWCPVSIMPQEGVSDAPGYIWREELGDWETSRFQKDQDGYQVWLNDAWHRTAIINRSAAADVMRAMKDRDMYGALLRLRTHLRSHVKKIQDSKLIDLIKLAKYLYGLHDHMSK